MYCIRLPIALSFACKHFEISWYRVILRHHLRFHHCHIVTSRMNHHPIPLLNNCCYNQNHLNEHIFTLIMRPNWFPEFLIGKIFHICQMKILKILASKLNCLCLKVDLLVVNKVIITQRRFRIEERKC